MTEMTELDGHTHKLLNTTDKVYKVWEKLRTKVGKSFYTMYVPNEVYFEVCENKPKHITIPDETGMRRKYIMKKEGIYVNKKETSIVVPLLFDIFIKTKAGLNWDDSEDFATQTEDEFIMGLTSNIINNHSGNHYRNNFVSVPSKVYGRN